MSDALIEQARELARLEREEEERAFQLRAQIYGYGVNADASTPAAPGKASRTCVPEASTTSNPGSPTRASRAETTTPSAATTRYDIR